MSATYKPKCPACGSTRLKLHKNGMYECLECGKKNLELE